MANVTISELLDTQKSIVEEALAALDDPDGVVLTRDRYIDEDQWIKLFMAMNQDESPKGVMILWHGLEQRKGDAICQARQTHRFSYEILYPFDDNRPDGLTSYEVFVERVETINNALNVARYRADFDLGIENPGAEVEHHLLQSDGEIQVRRWGTGPTAVKTHYATFTFDVGITVNVHRQSFS